jgi:hypothetical protein
MNTRRSAIVVLLATAGLALTACSTSTPSSTPTSAPTTTPALTPAQRLTAALAKFAGAGYDVKVTFGPVVVTGSVDNSTHSATLLFSGTVGGVHRQGGATKIGEKLWLKVDFGPQKNQEAKIDPTKWMLVDPAKLKPGQVPFDLTGPDALQVAGVLTSVTNVTATDATHLSGTVDLTKAIGPSTPGSTSAIQSAGSAAAAVPFTVTLDDQGRMLELKITADASHPLLSDDIVFSNYGSPSPITAPADADVVPAVPALYGLS